MRPTFVVFDSVPAVAEIPTTQNTEHTCYTCDLKIHDAWQEECLLVTVWGFSNVQVTVGSSCPFHTRRVN
jgi:hypothetical protein